MHPCSETIRARAHTHACWQFLHIASNQVQVHTERTLWQQHAAPALPHSATTASLLWTHGWRWARSCRKEADGKMKTGGKTLLFFFPHCHSGSYVTLLCSCLLPGSCWYSAFLILFLPHGQHSSHSLSIPLVPEVSPFLFHSSSLNPQVSFHLPSPDPLSSPFTNVTAIGGLILTSNIVVCCRQRHFALLIWA